MLKNDNAEFRRRLGRLPKAIRDQVNIAIEKDAEEWVSTAKRLAPDDPKTVAHDLKDSIRNQRSDTGGQIVEAGGAMTTKEGVDYALQQEFGNVRHPASPFFYPAYRLLRKRFKSRRARALSKAVKEFNNGK